MSCVLCVARRVLYVLYHVLCAVCRVLCHMLRFVSVLRAGTRGLRFGVTSARVVFRRPGKHISERLCSGNIPSDLETVTGDPPPPTESPLVWSPEHAQLMPPAHGRRSSALACRQPIVDADVEESVLQNHARAGHRELRRDAEGRNSTSCGRGKRREQRQPKRPELINGYGAVLFLCFFQTGAIRTSLELPTTGAEP